MIYRHFLEKKFIFYNFFAGTDHILDLAGNDGMNAISDHVEWLIKTSYNWFAHSIVKQNEYKTTLELVGFASLSEIISQESDDQDVQDDDTRITLGKEKALKLLSPSDTRWLVIADCLERILKQVSLWKKNILVSRHKPLVCIYHI